MEHHALLVDAGPGGLHLAHRVEMDDIRIVQHLRAFVLRRAGQDVPVLVTATQHDLPDTERWDLCKVRQEILHLTFELKSKPLSKICSFIFFSGIKENIARINKLGIASSLKPDFHKNMVEYFSTE